MGEAFELARRLQETASAVAGVCAHTQQPLLGLRELAAMSDRVELAKGALVRAARAAGESWGSIAASLGISRQAAQSRWK